MLSVEKDGLRIKFNTDPKSEYPNKKWIEEYREEIWSFAQVVRTMPSFERDFGGIEIAIHNDRTRAIEHVISIAPGYLELCIFSKEDPDQETIDRLLTIANKAIITHLKKGTST